MRVIAGRLGGRKLVAPKGETTRPTSDRVREALFSILGDLEGARVLDLYAGTGALGIEAISRGAAQAVFVEHAAEPVAALRKNIESLGIASTAVVLHARVERASGKLVSLGPFDCAFVDPPYAITGEAVAALGALASRDVFSEGAMIVLEHEARAQIESKHFSIVDRRAYGTTGLSFLRPIRELDRRES